MPGARFSAVFFDLDGTLVDIHRPLFTAARAAMADVGHNSNLTESRYRELLASNDVWLGVPESIFDKYLERVREHLRVQMGEDERMDLLPQVESTLVELKRRGYSTAVVTSRTIPREELARKLTRANIAQHLDHIVTQKADAVRALDKTESLRETAARASAHPRECVYVGDEPRDVMAARGAEFGAAIGVATGAASFEYLRDHQRHRPHHVIRSMADLLDAIAELEARGAA